jgi:hypothetical protein
MRLGGWESLGYGAEVYKECEVSPICLKMLTLGKVHP